MLRRCIWKIMLLPWFGINSLGLLLFVVVTNGMPILIVVPWEEKTKNFRYRSFLSCNYLILQLNCFSYWNWVHSTYTGINSRDVHICLIVLFSFIFYGIYLMMWGRESSKVSVGSVFNKLGIIYWVYLIFFLNFSAFLNCLFSKAWFHKVIVFFVPSFYVKFFFFFTFQRVGQYCFFFLSCDILVSISKMNW